MLTRICCYFSVLRHLSLSQFECMALFLHNALAHSIRPYAFQCVFYYITYNRWSALMGVCLFLAACHV